MSAGPVLFFAALMVYEVLLWRLVGKRIWRAGYVMPIAAYAGRALLLVAYLRYTGTDLTRYLAEDVVGGAALGALAIAAMILAWRRQLGAVPRAVRAKPGEIAVWGAYVLVAVAVVEEAIFRGALFLAVGGGPLAYAGSSAAHALWHAPTYRAQWPGRWQRELVKPLVASLLMATLAVVSGSLWAPILAHAAMDILGNIGHHAPSKATAPAGG